MCVYAYAKLFLILIEQENVNKEKILKLLLHYVQIIHKRKSTIRTCKHQFFPIYITW